MLNFILNDCDDTWLFLFKELGLDAGEDLCNGLNMDDIAMSFEDDDGLFECSQGGDLNSNLEDCLFMEKNLSATESNGPVENNPEVTKSSIFTAKFDQNQ